MIERERESEGESGNGWRGCVWEGGGERMG